MQRIFSEVVRQQKIAEIFGQKVANDGVKWIPVKVNRRVPLGMPPNIYDFEGVKVVRKNGQIVTEVARDNVTPVIGSRAAEDQESPYGFIKVAPTENNIAKLERYAALASTTRTSKSKDGGEEYEEIRTKVPKYERLDVEDEEYVKEIARRVSDPEIVLKILESDPSAMEKLATAMKKQLGL